jgi:hypothetical protein
MMTGKPALIPSGGYQRTLFPLQLTEIFRSDIDSADLKIIGRATNGKDYAIKTVNDSPRGRIPACELFCYELANLLQIATPDYHLITMSDSTLAFGSAWEGGVISLSDNTSFINLFIGNQKPANLVESISKIYALDIFVNNVDRHFKNYIFRSGYKSNIVLAMDFSRAWYEIDPYGYDAAYSKDCNTSTAHEIMRKLNCFDSIIALNTLRTIKNINQDTIRQIISLMPSDWISLSDSSKFIEWWGSSDFLTKLDMLEQVI